MSQAHQNTKRSATGAPEIYFPYGAPPSKKAEGNSERKLTSQRLNPHKCANPFASNFKACKSLFSQSYIAGSIPCRLQSSSARFSLQWDQHAASGFSPDLLVVCADGLSETEHPYAVMAPMMFHELVLRGEGCVEMFAPVMDPIVANLRKALLQPQTFSTALSALSLLVQNTGNLIFPHLQKIVPVLAKMIRAKEHRDNVLACLAIVEQQCGPEASKIIKSKIPTY